MRPANCDEFDFPEGEPCKDCGAMCEREDDVYCVRCLREMYEDAKADV